MIISDIKNLVNKIQPKFLIIGDGCTDLYYFGHVNRLSPEAPVPIFDAEYVTKKYGMAYNVYDNLTKLNRTDVDIFADMRETKNRYIDLKSNQQLLRVDEKSYDGSGVKAIDRCMAYLERFDYSVVVISDYDKGTVSYEDMVEIIQVCNRKGTPVFIDTKKTDLFAFEGAYIKINENEYNNKDTRTSKMIVTRADKDVVYYPMSYESVSSTYPVQKKKFRDVTGAGDTFLAAVAFMFALTNDINSSIKFAIQASQVSIQHYGCYAPTLEEICDTKEE